MYYTTKSCFAFLLIWLISKTTSIKQIETIREYNNASKTSFYHYAPEFLNTRKRNDDTIIQKKPKILGDHLSGTSSSNKTEMLEEFVSYLATWRYQPVVLLMDDTCTASLNAEYFTNSILNKANIRNEFWLMKFNTSGVTRVLAQFRINSDEFKKYINNEKEKSTEVISEEKGSTTFFAILKAAQILPKNSAILLITEKKPIDENLSQLALSNLIQKQIQLYVIWNGSTSRGQEEKLLKEAIYSKGTFYQGNYFNRTTECKKIQNKIMRTKEEILVKKIFHKEENIPIPIDSTMVNIDIIIEGNLDTATITSPSGYTANLLNLTSMQRLSPGAASTHVQGNWTHVQFNMMKVSALPFIGMWQIKIKQLANHNTGYNITVYAETELTVSSELLKHMQTDEVVSSLSYVDQNKQRDLPLITIESSVRSNLIATAGSNPRVVFEVTNNIDRPLFVPFSVQDEKSMLRDLVPRSTLIPPKSSVEVTVYTTIPSISSLQYTNLITLTAYGQVRAQKAALLYVNSMTSRELDTTLPYLNYKFVSTCMEVPHSSCNSGIWSIEVTAQDSESGLLRIITEPAGLYSRNGYISGTKETVLQYYSSNCCQPYLEITAIDLNNNKRTYKADAYNATLSTGSIVAITLGVLLLIIIIIVVAILIRKYCKQRDSLDLPRYRGQTASRF